MLEPIKPYQLRAGRERSEWRVFNCQALFVASNCLNVCPRLYYELVLIFSFQASHTFQVVFCRAYRGSTGGRWSGCAMVLGKLPVLGRPTILITVGQGPIALAVGAGGGCLDIFTLIYLLFSFSLSLGDGRYRLKHCLKGPLNPKQPTNQINWWVPFAPVFKCCYFCESSCLFYLSFNSDFYFSKIMRL